MYKRAILLVIFIFLVCLGFALVNNFLNLGKKVLIGEIVSFLIGIFLLYAGRLSCYYYKNQDKYHKSIFWKLSFWRIIFRNTFYETEIPKDGLQVKTYMFTAFGIFFILFSILLLASTILNR